MREFLNPVCAGGRVQVIMRQASGRSVAEIRGRARAVAAGARAEQQAVRQQCSAVREGGEK